MSADWTQALMDRVHAVREQVEAATARRHAGEGEVRLLAATKGTDAATLRQVCALGLARFGESFLQEAVDKMPWTAGVSVEWHFIGHLQTNKAARALGAFDLIQSVDRLELAQVLSRRAAAARMEQAVLVQVNLGSEGRKHGFLPGAVRDAARRIADLPGLDLQGLMVVSPLLAPEASRPLFAGGRELFENIRSDLGEGFRVLSMGMSADFEVAIEEGSNMVRVGTAIFGPRPSV